MASGGMVRRFKLLTMMSAGAFALTLSGGSAHANAVTVTSDSLAFGGVSVKLKGSFLNAPNTPVANPVLAGRQDLNTTIGALQTYCVDIFHYSATATFNNNPLNNPASHAVTGLSTVATWTSSQVDMITALLQNGSLQTQNLINTSALQIAIWEVEYATKLASGSYDLLDTSGAGNASIFYFATSSDSNSGTAINQAQSYLNKITNGTWTSDSNSTVYELSQTPENASSNQNLIYLVPGNGGISTPTPEPSTIGIFGIGLAGLWTFMRRRRTA